MIYSDGLGDFGRAWFGFLQEIVGTCAKSQSHTVLCQSAVVPFTTLATYPDSKTNQLIHTGTNQMLSYILAVLASYRVARMLAIEEGPLELFARVRDRFDPEQKTWLGRGLNCPLCIGFYVSFVMALLLAHQDPTMHRSETLLAWLGIAGAQTLLHLWTEK